MGCSILYADLSRSSQGVITDNTAKLQWQDNTPAKNMSWKDALGYCKALTLDGGDWRLPQIKELKLIINNDRESTVTNNSFKHTNTFAYWSSTPVTNYPNTTWGVYMYYGMPYWDSKNSHSYVKCVRNKE